MALTSILALMVNLAVIRAGTDVGPEGVLRSVESERHFDVYANAIAKAHYNPWFCNYFREPGYKCTSCSDALHCFPGNFALLVQCAGRLPYCNNGYCSAIKTEKCFKEPKTPLQSDSAHNKPTEAHDDDKIEVEKPKSVAEEIATSTNAADARKEARRSF